ncbi:caspase family protein [Pseudogulbenkiania subflava]|uniref:Caspase domain-containing protein n=1 Tax=Pseudogulbenkiania subflava DSM 22618 TaxID=1123014 RepID=A0A1Y6BML5_9NEIS|nr:caspase family protein [Pseudogulbenkiania subflava]SMF08542.1 Caspase domain-containing protein [Pseudogulbenkiania subflava DSM 22618]
MRLAELLRANTTMQRKALIIGCPDEKIPGVNDDMRNYRAFFESPAGGGWLSSEIKTLQSPSMLEVQREMKELTSADYSIVVFAGHGEYSHDTRSTQLHLGPDIRIDEYMLKEGAPRHTLIIDACRVHSDTPLLEQIKRSSLALASLPDVSLSRMAFDNHLRKCRPDVAVMYACKIGEAAGDSPGQGGTYSSTLLSESREWASNSINQKTGVLSVSEVHALAVPLVYRQRGGRQTPTGVFPRTVPHFPFAICA